ncbi:TraX family protein [Hydrogenophaga crassostreae]|nr:TraX family protein [Hydrogenophaga crassostreae]
MRAILVPNGSIELLKWAGLVLMTGDHVNKYLFNETLPMLYEAGRVCLPVFLFVLAYNLARPGALTHHVYERTMLRLGVFGLLACPPFVLLGGLSQGWWPLNVLFTLLVVAATAYLIEKGGAYRWTALATFLIGGVLVEYWWPAVALGLCCWWYFKNPNAWALIGALLSCALLAAVNGNHWALAAIPLIALFARANIPASRIRWMFYVYYPVHLVAIALIRIPMRQAGYLFN